MLWGISVCLFPTIKQKPKEEFDMNDKYDEFIHDSETIMSDEEYIEIMEYAINERCAICHAQHKWQASIFRLGIDENNKCFSLHCPLHVFTYPEMHRGDKEQSNDREV